MHAVMSPIRFVWVLLFLGSLHARCLTGGGGRGRKVRSKDKVLALSSQRVDAFWTGDLDANMKFWHPDAYASIEGLPLAHGLEAIRAVQGRNHSTIERMDGENIEVGPNDKEVDYVHVLFNQKWYNGDEQTGDKTIISVWRNSEDGFKIDFFMVNSNA